MLDRRAVFVFLLLVPLAARAQMRVSNTAHPALLRPAADPYVRDAARSDLFTAAAGRAWHLEARTSLATPPGRTCRQCDHRVINRNSDLCDACAEQWRASGARGWDFPAP